MTKVRIVHPGGPASQMRVYVGDQQLLPVAKVELVLDPADDTLVAARLTIVDVELDVIADIDDLAVLRVPQPTNGTDPMQVPAGYFRGRHEPVAVDAH